MHIIRRQMRALALGLMAAGVLWVHLMNYVRLGRTPLDMVRDSPLAAVVLWGGALGLGLAVDALVGFFLRRFFAILRAVEAGRPVDRAEVQEAATTATRFPETASMTLILISVGLTLLFHTVSETEGLAAVFGDPGRRWELVTVMLRELALSVLLSLLLFTFSRRILRQAVAGLGLQEATPSRYSSVGLRMVLVLLAVAVTYTSLTPGLPGSTPPERLLSLYLPLLLLVGLVGYLVAGETGRDLESVTARLRVLAAGVRPDLFHRLPVTGNDEVAQLVAAINGLQDRVEAEFRSIERDLQAARAIQMQMLPHTLTPPAGWDLAARLAPAQQVGGDFYEFISLDQGRFGLAVGDAAGKGLPAALIMASALSLLRAHAPQARGPGRALEAVNRLLAGSLPPMTFVTAVYAVIDPARRQVTLSSAGHLPPVAAGQELDPLAALPLGVDSESRYPEITFTLGPGDSLLLYSDGLPEAANPAGTLLGTERLAALMQRRGLSARHLVDDLLQAAAQHTRGGPPADDRTAVVLVAPAELTLELPSRHGSELIAAEEVSRFAASHGPPGRAGDVSTAVAEACLNAIVHGNRLQEDLPVVVRVLASPAALEVTVADSGPPFTPPAGAPDLKEQMAGEEPFRGWGIPLIRATADSMTIETLGRGKQVRLRFYARGESHV